MADDMTADAPASPNIGAAINEKLAESFKNLDVLSMIRQMVENSPNDEESQELKEKLQSVLDKYNSMDGEEQVEFITKLRDGLASKLSSKLSDPNVMKLDGLQEAISQAIMYRLIFIGVCGFLLIIVVVFFGYKLYKSIKEKEKKKEEKKKAKQMKKKK